MEKLSDQQNEQNVKKSTESIKSILKEKNVEEKDIRRIYLKLSSSISIPIFTQLTDREKKISKTVQ